MNFKKYTNCWGEPNSIFSKFFLKQLKRELKVSILVIQKNIKKTDEKIKFKENQINWL